MPAQMIVAVYVLEALTPVMVHVACPDELKPLEHTGTPGDPVADIVRLPEKFVVPPVILAVIVNTSGVWLVPNASDELHVTVGIVYVTVPEDVAWSASPRNDTTGV